MAKLSQKLSQKHQTESKHAGYRPLFFENLFEYEVTKINSRTDNHRKADPFERAVGKIRSTEFFLRNEYQERRWSICCARVGRRLMLLTVPEVAKDHLKVSRSTVYRLIRNGELQSVKVLGCTRIAPTELERFERMIGGF